MQWRWGQLCTGKVPGRYPRPLLWGFRGASPFFVQMPKSSFRGSMMRASVAFMSFMVSCSLSAVLVRCFGLGGEEGGGGEGLEGELEVSSVDRPA